MCIIAFKDNYEKWDKDIITTCFKNNPDGAGAMWYNASGTLIFEKGFFELDNLLRFVDDFDGLSLPSVIHFRIKTHGSKRTSNCHPFLSKSKKLLLMHNGVLAGFNDDTREKDITDSELFLNNYLDKFTFKELKQQRMQRLLSYTIDCDKFVIASDKEKEFLLIGNFLQDAKYPDYFFSNAGYKGSKGFNPLYNKAVGFLDNECYDDFYDDGFSYKELGDIQV